MIMLYTQVIANKKNKANNRDEEHQSIAILENSLEKVQEWIALNKLKMNDTKSEAILFSNPLQLNEV